jgi:hypothetical protein
MASSQKLRRNSRPEESILSGKVWVDEAFFALERKKWVLVNGDGRGPRNQIMVLCGVDSSGRRFAVSSGSGHLTKAKVMRIYGNRIKPRTSVPRLTTVDLP